VLLGAFDSLRSPARHWLACPSPDHEPNPLLRITRARIVERFCRFLRKIPLDAIP
jgi:hypothetical protein